MRANDGTRTAGEVLIDQLVVHGAEHVFCVPGESYIAALDAFYDRDIAITEVSCLGQCDGAPAVRINDHSFRNANIKFALRFDPNFESVLSILCLFRRHDREFDSPGLLEDIVRQELKVFFGQPQRIAEHLRNADQNLAEKSALLQTHEREIQKVREEMTRTKP